MLKRLATVALALLSGLLSACAQTAAPAPSAQSPTATQALEKRLGQHDGGIYVYSDYADGWNMFSQRAWMGSHGVKPGDMQQDYMEEVFSGDTAIRCTLQFTALEWGGYMFLNGALPPGETEPVATFGETDAAMDLSGAASLRFYARGREGGEKVEFFCGGLGYNEFGPGEPFSDSAAKQSTGTVTLGTQWKAYTIALEGADMSRIGNGFTWVASAADNPGRDSIEFYLDEIRYDIPGQVPEKALLSSYYSPGPDSDSRLLNNFAFLNDNALACIALSKAGLTDRAAQIADAVTWALDNDRAYTDGRLRNGYMNGSVESYPGWYSQRNRPYAMMPGFYHPQTRKWHEDFYMVSTDAGSLAWAILALCSVTEAPDSACAQAADRIGRFALSLYDPEAGGYLSGYQGWEGQEVKSAALSVQFNLELMAAFGQLYALTGEPPYRIAAERALDAAFSFYDEASGCFLAGTGQDIDEALLLLATNATAVMALPERFSRERERALDYILTHMKAGDGYACFAGDESGVWLDGTAQVGLALLSMNRREEAEAVLSFLRQNTGPDGSLYSASVDYLPSGRINPADGSPNYFYHRLHLGATAWLSLLETGHNPLQWAGE